MVIFTSHTLQPISLVLGMPFGLYLREWRAMHLPKGIDPKDIDKIIFRVGFGIVLSIELYKFIVFIATK